MRPSTCARSVRAAVAPCAAANPSPAVRVTAATTETTPPVQDKEFFAFPYEPYDIQLQLMQQLHATIDKKHIGIFESPTGTVRSCARACHFFRQGSAAAYVLSLPVLRASH